MEYFLLEHYALSFSMIVLHEFCRDWYEICRDQSIFEPPHWRAWYR